MQSSKRYSKLVIPVMLGFMVFGGLPACSHITNTEQVTPKDIPLTRTRQQRIVSVSQSEFVFTSSVEIARKLGFNTTYADPERMTLSAFKTHNGKRISFHLKVIPQGTDNLIDMETRYYDSYAADYKQPYEAYSAMMWDYLGQPLQNVY